MANVSLTFNVPAAKLTVAKTVFDAVGQGAQGMFPATIVGGELNPESGTPIAYCSSGVIDDQNPVVQGRAAVKAALADTAVTEADIDEVYDALDVTPSDARQRAREVSEEVTSTISAADWVQPTGAQDAYALGAVAKHNGKTWTSLQAANVFEPGVASWREVWGTATDTPPDWVQPTGSTDFYPAGARVTHNNSTWVSIDPVNVWEPGVFGWTEEGGGAPSVEPWSQGGGTGTAGSYLQDYRWSPDPTDTQVVEVTHPNAQDGGNVWLFRSKIPANTTEPGTDGTFHRWWEPVEPV
jgi:hypothetical protein